MAAEEPERDPELAELMRASVREPPMERVDWAELHTRVVDAAKLPLARRRRQTSSWWRVAAQWSRPATWTAAAAAALFAFAILASERGPARMPAVSRVGPEPSALLVGTAIAEDPGVALLFVPDRAALLQAAIELE